MIVVLLIGLVFAGLACVLLVRSAAHYRLRSEEALRQIDLYGFDAEHDAAGAPHAREHVPGQGVRSVVDSLASTFGAVLTTRIRRLNEDSIRKDLLAAGMYNVPPRRFVGYQALATIGLGLIWIWLAKVTGRPTPVAVIGTILALVAGWWLPLSHVKRKGRQRAELINYAMPELIDTLVATVEAGVAFAAAMQIASRRFRGPLGEELRLTMQEQSMGLGLNDALANLLGRQNTRSVRAFVRALNQGDQLGVSIGQTLRNLAHDMRVLRRQLAEEQAHKAPVKMVFPLIICFFPALLTVILGPAFLRIHEIFK